MFARFRDGCHGSPLLRVVGRGAHSLRGAAAVAGFMVVALTIGPVVSAQATTSKPHRGGTVTQLDSSISPTIDPAFNLLTFADLPTLEAVYGPGLVYLNPVTDAVEMGFAQSLTSKDHGATWTLVLHSGLRFSDGTAFNAAAVAYNIARLADPTTGSTYQSAAAQLKTKVLSATKLQIICTPANALFPTLMSQDFAMIASPTALAAEGSHYGSHPVGAGPFQVETFTFGISWTFVRNPEYARYAPGQPYLNGIKILLANQQTAITDLQTGVAQTDAPLNAQTIAAERAIGFTVQTPAQPSIGYLLFNITQAPFNNILAREAVYNALDTTAISNVWEPGDSTATNLFGTKSPFYDKKLNFPTASRDKAQQLFNQLAAAGTPVKFQFLWSIGGGAGDVGAYLQGALSQFQNVTMTENAEPHTQYKQAQAAGGFQMAPGSLSSLVPGIFSNFQTGGATNWGKYSDPKLDAALVKLQTATSVALQKRAWTAIQQEINSQYLGVWCWRAALGFAYSRNKLGGVATTEYGQVPLWGPMYLK